MVKCSLELKGTAKSGDNYMCVRYYMRLGLNIAVTCKHSPKYDKI